MLRVFLSSAIIISLLPAGLIAQYMTAAEIVQKANDIINQETVFAKMKNFDLFKFSGV